MTIQPDDNVVLRDLVEGNGQRTGIVIGVDGARFRVLMRDTEEVIEVTEERIAASWRLFP